MGANDNCFVGKLVYVCGRSASTSNTEYFSLKGRLVSDLTRSCFVRTHASPVEDIIDAYCAIASSSAFVFTFNAHTIYDPECLNQLGIAILYNVPIVTVREESYEIPKPLPLRFYETKFIDKRVANHANKKEATEGPSTLAGVLALCYENSIVCKKSSYASFLSEVVRALPSYPTDAIGHAEQSTSEEDGTVLANDTRSPGLARPGVGSSRVSRRTIRTAMTSTTTQKQRGLENIYGVEQKLLNRQSLINRIAYKKLDLSFSGSSTAFSHSNNARKPQQKATGRQAFRQGQNLCSAKRKENRPVNDQDSPKVKEKIRLERKENTIITTHHAPPERVNTSVEMSKATSISAQELHVESVKSEGGLTVPVIGPKGRKLRRYSSLPVVPTQYLVASDSEHGSPQIMSFPPPSNNYHLSPTGDSPVYFSGDELDFDPIHISRACTPVEVLESTSISDSPEDSSR